VISVEAWTTIRYLQAQGMGARAIAAKVGVSRNTVRRAVRGQAQPQGTRAKRPNRQLVPYADAIARMVTEQQFIGSRVLRELRKQGYTGGATALYDYLAHLKEQRTRQRATERFETAPGEQGQFDWSPYRISMGGEVRRVVVFGLILGYSRRKFYLGSLDETQGSVFTALERGLAHFGGAPKTVLVDNAKALVDDARPEHFRWNARFLALCGHYRMEPRACAVRRAQTKGKIERPFQVLEEQFIKGSAFADLGAMNEALARFTAEELDEAVHRTTQARPRERFAEEAAALLPLPAHPCTGSLDVLRKVSLDCLISFGGSQYSVPHAFVGTQVWVRSVLGEQVEIADAQGRRIATHAVAPLRGTVVRLEEHYTGLRQRTPVTTAALSADLLARFPDQEAFVAALVRQYQPAPAAALHAVLELTAVYAEDVLRPAFTLALRQRCCTPQFVRGICAQAPARQETPARLAVAFGTLPASPAPRSLQTYQAVLDGSRG
jgi:transposase